MKKIVCSVVSLFLILVLNSCSDFSDESKTGLYLQFPGSESESREVFASAGTSSGKWYDSGITLLLKNGTITSESGAEHENIMIGTVGGTVVLEDKRKPDLRSGGELDLSTTFRFGRGDINCHFERQPRNLAMTGKI